MHSTRQSSNHRTGVQGVRRSSARRSLFTAVRERHSNSSLHQETRSFYNRSLSDDDLEVWQPGESLPNHTNPIEELKIEMHSMLSSMQASINSELTAMKNSLSNLQERMSEIETQVQSVLSEPVTPQMSTPGGCSDQQQTKRKRNTPLQIQSEIRTLYKSLPDEKQLNLEEGIDSVHNKQVVEQITLEMDGKYTVDQVRRGLSVYRRSLKRTSNDEIVQQRLQRSRQQRLWDRRAKQVRPEEQEQWKDVDPTMMSDEETIDPQTLKRRRPDWRSLELNSFIDELDKRSYQRCQHPQKVRVLGTPLKCPFPNGVKDWMINDSSD